MTEKFKVTGMSCSACSARVERAVSSLSGVDGCSVNLLTGDLTVNTSLSRDVIEAAVRGAGYGIADTDKETKDGNGKRNRGFIFYRLVSSVLLSAILMYLSMGHMLNIPTPAFIAHNPLLNAILQMLLSLCVMIINYRFFTSGFKGVIKGAPNMDTLVSLGSLVSFLYSVYITISMAVNPGLAEENLHSLYFESAAMILALITVGKLLEARAKGRTADAVNSLIDMSPRTANVIIDGEERTVLASSLKEGDLFIVKAGDMIPADGVVTEGEGSVDESSLTGESVFASKTEGTRVYASTINKSGYLVCRATEVGDNTVLSGIIRLVKDASSTKAPIAKLADRVSGIFVPLIMGLSLLTFSIWMIAGEEVGFAISRAIAVLVISCPCALGLATPVAIMVGGGVGAKRGILFKTAAALEECGRVDTVVLDKTGTVTKGVMSVVEMLSFSEDESLVLSLALCLERRSEHPIANAIVDYCNDRGASEVQVADFAVLEGRGVCANVGGEDVYAVSLSYGSTLCSLDDGVRAETDRMLSLGRTPVLIIRGSECLGIFAVADTVKDDAKEGVSALLSLGCRVVMLTGDHYAVASVIAKEVGIREVVAEVMPSDKEEKVRELMQNGRVLMVGDGINDSPALTRANVGMAIGRGTDIAIESADVVLMGDGIMGISHALSIGRATLKNIKENLFFAFLYNCIGIPLAMGLFGFGLPPMFGALAMSLSSFSVVMNALRLNLWKPKKSNSTAVKNSTEKEEKTEKEEIKMITKTITVKGMMCPHCEARVKQVLEALDGVAEAIPSHTDKSVVLTLTREIDTEIIKKTVEDAGYTFVS